jgi:succinoglycan biosynthesis transport protein ExoP
MKDEMPRIASGERSVPRTIEEPGFRLCRNLAVVRRRKWWVLAVTAVVVGSALTYSLLRPPVYESKSEVLVRAINLIPTEPSHASAINMEAERQMATSAMTRKRVDARLNRAGVAIGDVSVDGASSDFMLHFTAIAPDPVAARRTAEAFAVSYLELRRRQALEDLAAARKPFQTAIDANNRQLKALRSQLAAEQDEAQRAALQGEIDLLFGEQVSFKQSLYRLILPADLQVGQVLQPATRPLSPSSPDYAETGVFALFVGLLLGVGLAFLRDQLDQRVRSWEELKTLARAPVLAVLPRPRRGAGSQQLAADEESAAEIAEAFEALSRKVLAITSRSRLKFLMITSADASRAKTELTANLGAALAKAQKSVVIVGTELWNSQLGQIFHLADRRATGVQVLAENTATTDLQKLVANCWVLRENLLLLPLPKDLDLMVAATWKELTAFLEQAADIILVDSAPIPEVGENSTLATITDGVLMVVDAERATRSSVRDARHQLDRVGVATVGAVLVNHGAARFNGHHRRHSGQDERDAKQPAEQLEAVETENPTGPEGPEELRVLEAQVFALLRGHAPATNEQPHPPLVVLTVDRANNGNSTVAVDLAFTLAVAGKRIALIDLDPHRPAQRRTFDLLEGAGFAEVTVDGASPEWTIHRFTPVDAEHSRSDPDLADDGEHSEPGYVEVLAAGASPPGTGEVVTGPIAHRFLDLMRERVDLVLVDVPPVRPVGDALSLFPAVDALVVATGRNRVCMQLLNELRPALDTPAVPSVGAVTEAPALQTKEVETPRRAIATSADVWVAALIVIGGAIALLLEFADVKTTLYTVVTLLFLGFGPGASFVWLVQSMELPVKIMASIALSLAIEAAIAQVMIWSHVWSPKAGLVVAASVSMIGLVLQGWKRLRTSAGVEQGERG